MPAHLIAEEGPLRGLILNLEEGTEWIVGRDPESSDFTLEDSTVSRKHARLNRTAEGIYIKNLSKVNPTLVNDEEKPKAYLLKEGDRVHIGSNTFLFSEEALPKLPGEPALPEEKVAEQEAAPKEKKAKKKKNQYDEIFDELESAEEELPKEEESLLPIPPLPPKVESSSYDTIFEETGSGEELPFALIPEAPFALKVVAGPNAGAEIGIEKGRSYIIGKDPDSCDIVFQDLSVSRNHAKLSVSEDSMVRLEDLDSKNGVAVNGVIIVHPTTITSQDLVALGTTVFMVIDREAPQETIYSPMAQANVPPPVEEEVAPEVELPPVEEEPVARDWKKEPIPTKHLVMAGSVAAVFLVVFLTFFSLFKSEGMPQAIESGGALKEALAKFKDVQYSYNPGSGKLFLVGHVQSNVDYQEMQYRISQLDFVSSTQDNVVIDEKVVKTMNDILSSEPAFRAISISAPKPGHFVVRGYVSDHQAAVALSEYLTVNFPYLDKLHNQVVSEDLFNAQLAALVLTKRLGGVEIAASGGNVIIAGRYSEEKKKQFDQMLKEIHAMQGVSSVKNLAIAVSPRSAGIDVSEAYRVSGLSTHDGSGYSVVMNGRIYALGDTIDGMRITAIDPNAILLEKDGLKYRIDYTL